MESLEKGKAGKDRKKSLLRKYDNAATRKSSRYEEDMFISDESSEEITPEMSTEDYWFICKKWLARSEDDGKIVRELIATDESGKPLDGGLEGKVEG